MSRHRAVRFGLGVAAGDGDVGHDRHGGGALGLLVVLDRRRERRVRQGKEERR